MLRIQKVYMKLISWISRLNIGMLSKIHILLKQIQQILHWKLASEGVHVLKLGGWWVFII